MSGIKSAILTGPTGVVGTALVKKLAEYGVKTYVMCHVGSPRNISILEHPCIYKIECNMEEIGRLPEIIGESVEAFFHLAWLGTQVNSNRMDMYLQNRNVQYTLDALYAAKNLGCKVFIGAGSQAEYGRIDGVIRPDSSTCPISGYGMAKLCAGQMTRALCKEFGIRHIWPRIVSVYGENDSAKTLVNTIIDNLSKGISPKLTAGEQMWDYLYSEDAAEALYLMADKGKDGSVYVLGSGVSRPLKEFMMEIREAINPKAVMGIGEIPYLKDQVMNLKVDNKSLIMDTGWKPSTSFAVGIKKTIAMFNAYKQKFEYLR